MTSFLGPIGTAVPTFDYGQMDLFAAMQQRLPLARKQEKALRGLYKHSGINTRYSVLPDFKEDNADPLLYGRNQDFPPLSERMACYLEQVLPLALQAVKDTGEPVDDLTHLIAVSCTGLAAPGLDLMLLKALNLPAHVHRTCVHYMGCYAALHALKQADAICRADPDSRVLVVCVELCTLHFQQDTSWDHLTSSLLFADGAAAVVVSGTAALPRLALKSFYSEVALEGWDEMAWHPDEKGFLMRLGRGVPFMLQESAEPLLQNALARHGHPTDIAEWAIHPGGRLILDLLIKTLNLPENAFWASRQVLANYGNMSSPTVLFVLQAIQEKLLKTRSAATDVFAAAFGPGLTMETALLRWNTEGL